MTAVTTIDLKGTWKMRRVCEDAWIPATVPGSVYYDLLNAGLMEDPYYRDNDIRAAKLSDYDYEYSRIFEVNSELLKHDRVFLRFEGLDTLAELHLNGRLLAKTDNMHRTYEFDVKDFVAAGENDLLIVFRSPTEYVRRKYKENPIWSVNGIEGFQYIRKAHYMFGWDWGPCLPDMGIWRNVSLIGQSIAALDEVYVTQKHGEDAVDLDIRVGIDAWTKEDYTLNVTLRTPAGEILMARQEDAQATEHIGLQVTKPELWWPNGFGAQPLYELEVVLMSGELELGRRHMRIGLRTMTVTQQDDQWGRSFSICVNGHDIFAMGGNYIPEDQIIARTNREKTERLIQDCVAANNNCIRVWGGGYYAEDYFYDLCDEYGLIVWQDHLYACAVYDFTEEFKENIVQETIQNMKRIRHHASLGLWCGNNEMEWAWVDWDINQSLKLKADYIKQFEVVLPELAREIDPNTFYWLASPSSFGSFEKPNDENYGDMHDWSIWHGRKPFTDFRNRFPRFMSEFGLQAFPSMKTIDTFALPEDHNVYSYVMEDHQKHPSGIEPTVYYLSQYFKFPKDFQSFPYVSQLIQAEGVRYGVEHWRRHRGRCMGAVYWQLNDSWPVTSWASIDSYGRWKALHYAARKFFAPVLLSAWEEGVTASLHVSNESLNPFKGKVHWSLKDRASKVIREGQAAADVPALTTVSLAELDFAAELDSDEKKRRHYLEYTLVTDEGYVSDGCTIFLPAKHFELLPASLQATVEETADAFEVTVLSDVFAMFVELEMEKSDAVFSDNYFHLTGGVCRKVVALKSTLSEPLTLDMFKAQLKLRSLEDSY
ncbi:glycoside hydrolase [Paenibacillus swuensis]|uniref:Beta-mannosidase B n=1 Tax=Paenibacillus swuensis TaxID=1178515 RepID=A0A172TFA1_9BACL|nr:glycoside hydrolase family 2 protein [Paenibacillus swuensis]ANE45728.1 glycoside hydrolase [Paenibacillus swuensis]